MTPSHIMGVRKKKKQPPRTTGQLLRDSVCLYSIPLDVNLQSVIVAIPGHTHLICSVEVALLTHLRRIVCVRVCVHALACACVLASVRACVCVLHFNSNYNRKNSVSKK